jgi:hypothetical protein
LQIQHRKGKQGLNAVAELAVGQDKPQSSTRDDLQTTRKYLNEFQKEKLSTTKEINALRSEQKK